MSRAASERVLGFRMLLPPLERGHVPRVYVREEGLGSVLLRRGKRTLLLSEFVSTNFGVLKKAAVGATTVERVSVDGGVGIWITGAPHVLVYLDRDGRFRERPVRVTGSVLLWERGPLTLRLEGDLSKDEAARLARSVR
jgi:hypothetical protein